MWLSSENYPFRRYFNRLCHCKWIALTFSGALYATPMENIKDGKYRAPNAIVQIYQPDQSNALESVVILFCHPAGEKKKVLSIRWSGPFLFCHHVSVNSKQNKNTDQRSNVSASVQFLTYYALTYLMYWILSREPVLYTLRGHFVKGSLNSNPLRSKIKQPLHKYHSD